MKKDKPRELAHDEGKEGPALIASMPAGAQQRIVALGIVILFSVVFAVVIPYAPLQVDRSGVLTLLFQLFIPSFALPT